VTAEARLVELGIELPQVFPPAGLYVGAVRTGDLLFLSGAGPVRADGTVVTGKVGRDVEPDHGRDAARLTGVQLLATMRAELGSLDRVARVVKILGLVNGAPDVQPDPPHHRRLLRAVHRRVRGGRRSARSAVGVAELPFDISVEIEAVVEVRPDP